MKKKKHSSIPGRCETTELSEANKERLMIEYYRTMAGEQDGFLEKAWPVVNEIVRGWDER